ncbi:helix-turn-helix transcriptional regulator [Streptomyces sp. MST-110588]|uniref:helix-turn-helix transcriptional regulator n=1 Tax=Streptomyces sp. MST-110588 TaxID=2833628 RepID=UPI00206BAA9D|nr:helix-turn-helix transcriptional regulator [Streptomyces sp. MST-110588]
MSLRHAVLGLLAEAPASGYDLMKLFDASLSHVWPATQSQVYGELNKLTAAGFVEVVAHGPRGRKEYALTREGLSELQQWLVEVEPSRPQRHDMLLRVFFLGVLTPLEARMYLLHQAERAARARTGYQQVLDGADWDDEMISVYGRIALEYGLRMTAMQEEWARWAADEINSERARKAAESAGTVASELSSKATPKDEPEPRTAAPNSASKPPSTSASDVPSPDAPSWNNPSTEDSSSDDNAPGDSAQERRTAAAGPRKK